MGVVYAAYDPQLDRRVALKVLKGDGFDPIRSSRGQAQLVREAQSMARLSHPNVVTVHDVGTLAEPNMVFVAMEFIEGIGLRQYCQTPGRRWGEIVDVLIQAGRGLAAAHDAGLVHRDFKPDNVLVGDDGRVVVTDFGLARRLEGDDGAEEDEANATFASPDAQGSDHGTLGQAGTPAYMPPETHLGRRPSAAGDQFSFAVTLYEALFGEHPFQGDDPVSLATSVMQDERRPGRDDVRVPPRLRRAVDRALSHDPLRRWPSMRPFLTQLAACRRSKKPLWVATALGVCSLGVALVAGSNERRCEGARDHLRGVWDQDTAATTQRAFTDPQTDEVRETWRVVEADLDAYADAWVQVRTEACEATARGEQSQNLLDLRMQCLDRRRESLYQAVEILGRADALVVGQARQTVARLPSLDPCSDPEGLRRSHPPPSSDQEELVARIDTRLSRARALFNAGLLHSARKEVDAAVGEANRSDFAPIRARALLESGTIAAAMGDTPRAKRQLFDALHPARKAGDEALELRTWFQLLLVVGVQERRPQDAEQWYPTVEALIDRLGGTTDDRASLESARGAIAQAAGRPTEAARHFERALALRHESSGPDRMLISADYARLAAVLAQQARYVEAGRACERAMGEGGDAVGTSHPQVVRTTQACATMERERGNLIDAERLYRDALSGATASFGRMHPLTALLTADLGEVRSRRGDFAEAEQLHLRALDMVSDTAPHSAITSARIRLSLAETLLETGRVEEAGESLDLARPSVVALEPSDVRLEARLELLQGRVHFDRRDLDPAVAAYERSVELLEAVHPAPSIEARSWLALAELERGRPVSAQRQVERAVSMLDRVDPRASVRARARYVQARVAHALDGTGRDAALEALALWVAQPQRHGPEAREVLAWLEQAAPR